MLELKEGMVAGIIKARAKVRTKGEWQKSVDDRWGKAYQALHVNPGFKALVAFWDTEDSGDVLIMGLWENLDARLNYEATAAASVRELFNPLFEEIPKRHRYVITHSQTLQS